MQAWGAVSPHGGEVGDGERGDAGRHGVAAVESDDAGPQTTGKASDIRRLDLELGLRRHTIHHDRRVSPTDQPTTPSSTASSTTRSPADSARKDLDG
jgi:hypothetical protein